MDLSKLPKLSETSKQVPPPQPEAPAAPVEIARYAEPAVSGGEVWLSVAIGLIIQFMSGRFWSFAASKFFGSEFTWTFSDANGPITYTQSVYFWGDVALVLFGAVLILEGLLAFVVRNKVAVTAIFGVTVLTTGLNLFFLISMMNGGYGLQLTAAFAVIFGVYIAMYQWKLIARRA